MPKKGKKTPQKEAPEIVRAVLSPNIRTLFDHVAKHPPFEGAPRLPEQLAQYIRDKKWGRTVSTTHLYRAQNGTGSVGVHVVDLIARAYGIETWELFVPDWSPDNRPLLVVPKKMSQSSPQEGNGRGGMPGVSGKHRRLEGRDALGAGDDPQSSKNGVTHPSRRRRTIAPQA